MTLQVISKKLPLPHFDKVLFKDLLKILFCLHKNQSWRCPACFRMDGSKMDRQTTEKKHVGILFGTYAEKFLNKWKDGCADSPHCTETFCLGRSIVTTCERTLLRALDLQKKKKKRQSSFLMDLLSPWCLCNQTFFPSSSSLKFTHHLSSIHSLFFMWAHSYFKYIIP